MLNYVVAAGIEIYTLCLLFLDKHQNNTSLGTLA